MPSFADALMQGQQFAQQQQMNKKNMAMQDQQLRNAKIQEMVNNMGLSEARRKKMLGDFEIAGRFLQQGNQQGATSFLIDRARKIKEDGGDPSDTLELMREITVNPQQAFGKIQALTDAFKPQGQKLEFKEGFVFNPQTGEVTRPKIVDEIRLKQNQGVKLTTDDKLKYNKEVTNFLKDTKKINQAAKDLTALQSTSSPTDQLAAIFKFMKSLDPTSVVREGEQQMARSTGGPADAFIGYINQVKGEGGLTPVAFKNMVNTAITLSNASVDGSVIEVGEFLDTFGDDIGQNFRTKLMDRIPEKIQITDETKEPQSDASNSFTSSGGIKFTVE